jgi:hypothetical protein
MSLYNVESLDVMVCCVAVGVLSAPGVWAWWCQCQCCEQVTCTGTGTGRL